MFAAVRITVPPALAGVVFADNLIGSDHVNLLLNIAALAILFAGFFVVSKTRAERDAYKSQVAVHESAAKAWREERDAAVSASERLREDLKHYQESDAALQVEIAQLQARPDISLLAAKLDLIETHLRNSEVEAHMKKLDV